jgi:hypothetical protein
MGTASLILAAIAMVCFMAAGVCLASANNENWGGIVWAGAASFAGIVLLVLAAVFGVVWYFS